MTLPSSSVHTGAPETRDFFSDPSVAADPYAWYEEARERGPVWQEPHHGVFFVTGQREVVEVLTDTDRFSACVSVSGPFHALPKECPHDDVSDVIAEQRGTVPMSEYVVTMDPPDHTRHRGLLMRLLTPRRLKETEPAVLGLVDRYLDPLLEAGSGEMFWDYGKPFATIVVADLLGVPEEDHQDFRKHLGADKPGVLGDEGLTTDPLAFLNEYFSAYIEDRRRSPRPDVLTALAQATFPDGSTPEVIDVVRIATFLFAAGQDTSARLVVTGAHQLAEDQEQQQWLREHPDSIGDFIEEMLRLESPTKSTSRMAKRTTTVGGVTIPAGSTLTMLIGAANRDPSRFEDPDSFDIDRKDPYNHVAFGRGVHACPGGSLARLEARLTFDRLLAKTSSFHISEEHHGAPGARRYDYDPTFILRGLSALHLEFTPAARA